MHIDLNSAFATIEQQAYPLLRGKPVGVCSYLSPGGIVLAASYEAKSKGVNTGTPIRDAKLLCPDMVFLMPDPDKYFYINAKLFALLHEYTSDLTPLSIDEFAIDFSRSRRIHGRPLAKIALEIKARIKSDIGDWMRVNIGIGTNRFLAKTAAGLNKPDGLDIITAANLESIYASMGLRDLCGINYRYETRLNVNNIFTPLDFLRADVDFLHKRVFKSIEGYRWYSRLRGWEVDSVQYGRKSFGNDFALYAPTDDRQAVSRLFMKLAEKTGRRLRSNGYHARGAHLWLLYDDHSYWHKSCKLRNILYSTRDIYSAVQHIFNQQPVRKAVSKLGLSVFSLEPTAPEQLELFDTPRTKQRRIARAVDKMNDRYGEFTVISAQMMNMEDTIIKRVPFGATKDLKATYRTLIERHGLAG
jgi:DNA polymerase-4